MIASQFFKYLPDYLSPEDKELIKLAYWSMDDEIAIYQNPDDNCFQNGNSSKAISLDKKSNMQKMHIAKFAIEAILSTTGFSSVVQRYNMNAVVAKNAITCTANNSYMAGSI